MHPRVLAAQRAEAEERLANGLAVLADRAGVEFPPFTPIGPDPKVRDLRRIQWVADIVDRLNGVEPDEARPSEASSPPPQDSSEGAPPPTADELRDVLAGTVPEVKQHVKDVDDQGFLAALLAAEQESDRPRKGVIDAIEARSLALEDALSRDFLAGTVAEVEEAIAGIEDAWELRAVRSTEEAGANREYVLAAIDARIAAVDGPF